MVDTNNVDSSSEAAIYRGMPMKRQLSHQHLMIKSNKSSDSSPVNRTTQGAAGEERFRNSTTVDKQRSLPSKSHRPLPSLEDDLHRFKLQDHNGGDSAGGYQHWDNTNSSMQRPQFASYEPHDQSFVDLSNSINPFDISPETFSLWPIITHSDLMAATGLDGSGMLMGDVEMEY